MMDETEAWVGTILESGPSTTMVGMGPELVAKSNHAESRLGECTYVAWHWMAEGTGEVKVGTLTERPSPAASVGERWGVGGRPASIVSQWKGSSYILLVVLSGENSDEGEYLLFVGEGT